MSQGNPKNRSTKPEELGEAPMDLSARSAQSAQSVPASVPSAGGMSWADEVDQEFPEVLLAEECSRISGFTDTSQESTETSRWIPQSSSFPCGRKPNTAIVKSKKIIGDREKGRSVGQYNEADLLNRIQQLQEELSNTKNELRKARDEMKIVMRNERMLETIVHELRTEVADIKKKQMQLDFCGHEDGQRRPAAAKLNPEATPFVPVAQCCVGYQMKVSDAVRKDDPLRGVDSARSNVTNVSQMTGQTTLTALSIDVESYDSDNFVITHDDTQDDGAYGSEQEDLTPDSRRLRSRSQETYNRISSAASFKQSFNA
eukprot:EG_transcript_5853